MQLLAMNLGRTDDWIIERPFCKPVGVLRLQFFPVALRVVRKVLKCFFKISASLCCCCQRVHHSTHISLFSEYLGKLCVEVQGSSRETVDCCSGPRSPGWKQAMVEGWWSVDESGRASSTSIISGRDGGGQRIPLPLPCLPLLPTCFHWCGAGAQPVFSYMSLKCSWNGRVDAKSAKFCAPITADPIKTVKLKVSWTFVISLAVILFYCIWWRWNSMWSPPHWRLTTGHRVCISGPSCSQLWLNPQFWKCRSRTVIDITSSRDDG